MQADHRLAGPAAEFDQIADLVHEPQPMAVARARGRPPPTAPIVPVWPRRTKLLAEIWILALVVGAGLAYGLHVLRPIVSSVRAANEASSFPVLGIVSEAFPARDRARVVRSLWRFCAASAGLLVAFAVVLPRQAFFTPAMPRLLPSPRHCSRTSTWPVPTGSW